jgi:nucleotide-binding universal stress UspA family protein
MFDTILVPVDENTLSLRAVATAISLAEALSGRVALLHVALPLPAYTAAPAAAMELPAEVLRSAAESYGNTVLDGFRARVPEGLFSAAILRHARRSVWEEIVAAAEDGGADLIVMGTHGRDGVVRALMGSVAERVARHADVPVLLVR